MSSVFERIGGEHAILEAATRFYEKVLADPEVSSFFEGLDIRAQVRKQVALMSWAFGAPQKYHYRPLDEAHASLRKRGLNDRHFDVVTSHLASTFAELGVPPDLAAEALAIVARTRDQVMGRARSPA